MKKITKFSRIYSIGDIHGRSDLLEKLLKKIQLFRLKILKKFLYIYQKKLIINLKYFLF